MPRRFPFDSERWYQCSVAQRKGNGFIRRKAPVRLRPLQLSRVAKLGIALRSERRDRGFKSRSLDHAGELAASSDPCSVASISSTLIAGSKIGA
jgi:hypothetical protein